MHLVKLERFLRAEGFDLGQKFLFLPSFSDVATTSVMVSIF
jgi:hypothetical protein